MLYSPGVATIIPVFQHEGPAIIVKIMSGSCSVISNKGGGNMSSCSSVQAMQLSTSLDVVQDKQTSVTFISSLSDGSSFGASGVCTDVIVACLCLKDVLHCTRTRLVIACSHTGHPN